MNKTISVDNLNFKHKLENTELAFKQALDKNILIVSLKHEKTELTTSLTKADILTLIEYLKFKGFE